MYLKIKRSAMGPIRHGMEIGFTFKIEVLQAVGLPKEIFVFLKIPKPADPFDSDSVFQNIASTADLQEYPVNTPYPATNYPFFRLSEVTLSFRSEPIADDAWRCIQSDIQALLTSLQEASQLNVEEVVEYGSNPSSSSSSST